MLLTSHYMADVEALCRRVIVIHHGALLFDGDLTALVARFAPHKLITVEVEEHAAVTDAEVTARLLVDWSPVTSSAPRSAVTVWRPEAPTLRRWPAGCSRRSPVADLTIDEPPIERVIEDVFARPSQARPRG